jgi:spermidine/putrescine transport system ATP-binding protein
MESAPDLDLTSVSKRFDDHLAVDDVSFTVAPGEFFSILGPSGCGKTTLVRMIAGFEEPSAGEIRIRGRSVLGVPANRRPCNMVFQSLALFPMMSVGENIAYGLRCHGVGKAEAAERTGRMLDRVGLPGFADRSVATLSGGQRQRVAIARCLVLEPTLVLLDEPLGALDLKLREQMKLELKEIQATFNTSFVYITHDQSEALVMSDRVAVMNAGRIEQLAAPLEIYDQPATRFVADFIGETNFIRRNGGVVAVRPEQLRLTRDVPGVEGALGATVVATMVVGPAVQCVVRTEDGQEVLVREQRTRGKAGAESLEEGERVFVSWPNDEALELDATTEVT